MPRLAGTFTLLVTPFDAAGRLDTGSLARLLDHHLAAGTDGIFAVCGTSEMAELTSEERRAVAAAAVRQVGGAVPVVAAANLEGDPRAQGDEVARMAATGVDGIVLVPPRRHDGDPEALFGYLAALARRSSVPVLLYEWPGSRPSEIPAAVYGRLHAECGVAGIKDTTCTRAGISAKVAAAPAACVFQANNPLLLAAFDLGARGTMTITSAARPDLLAALLRAWEAGRPDEADALHREIVFLDAVLAPCHPGGAKWLLHRAGVIDNPAVRGGRLPGDAERAALEAWERRAPAWSGPRGPR